MGSVSASLRKEEGGRVRAHREQHLELIPRRAVQKETGCRKRNRHVGQELRADARTGRAHVVIHAAQEIWMH